MKIAFHCLAAAAFMMAGPAHAATVTVDVATNSYKGLKLSGVEVLSLSPDVLGALDTAKIVATANGSASPNIGRDSDGYYTVIQARAPISTLTIEDSNSQVQTSTAKGGLTLTAPVLRSVSSGGSLTITDLKVDLAGKKVYATLIGANGLGTVTDVYLWDVGGIVPTLTVDPALINNTATLSGLQITTNGFNQVAKALGLLTLGKSALLGASDFGVISVKLDAVPDGSGEPTPPSPPPTCAVTYKTTPVSDTTFDATVTVSNNATTTASDWKINWTYSAPTLVLKVKSVLLTNTNSTKLAATPASTNKVITAGGSTTFTFRAYSASGTPAASGMFATLGGQNCSVSTQ